VPENDYCNEIANESISHSQGSKRVAFLEMVQFLNYIVIKCISALSMRGSVCIMLSLP